MLIKVRLYRATLIMFFVAPEMRYSVDSVRAIERLDDL